MKAYFYGPQTLIYLFHESSNILFHHSHPDVVNKTYTRLKTIISHNYKIDAIVNHSYERLASLKSKD